MSPREAIASARLYGIVDLAYVRADTAAAITREMIDGGIDVLQLRAKSESPEAIESLGHALYQIASAADIPFIINDFPDIALRIGCDGVHVGQDDAPVARAREIIGPGKIVGQSTHSLEQAVAAKSAGADYIGFGPLFATATKPGRPAIGLDDIGEVHRLVDIPIFCIGGVKSANLNAVIAAGARRLVIVSELLEAPDVAGYIRRVKELPGFCEGFNRPG